MLLKENLRVEKIGGPHNRCTDINLRLGDCTAVERLLIFNSSSEPVMKQTVPSSAEE
jgi:hypothetical protein